LPVKKIGIIGPGEKNLCGIRDYSLDLLAAFKNQCEAVYFDYAQALSLSAGEIAECEFVFLQYEASLVPYTNYMESLGKILPTKLIVIPHEVYQEDPFAYPYDSLEAPNKMVLWLKQLNYRLKHKNYIHEKKLQQTGYHAAKVIPLSRVNFDILKELGATNIAPHIPLAYDPQYADNFNQIQSASVSLGIFGFLNPANDYQSVFQCLASLDDSYSLKIIGGEKQGDSLRAELEEAAVSEGLQSRISFTGFLSEEKVKDELNSCSAFICPFKFRSNSSSILKLLPWNKPVFSARIAMTEELLANGAPIHLYDSVDSLSNLLAQFSQGLLKEIPNQYIYDFETVVKMYLKRLN